MDKETKEAWLAINQAVLFNYLDLHTDENGKLKDVV